MWDEKKESTKASCVDLHDNTLGGFTAELIAVLRGSCVSKNHNTDKESNLFHLGEKCTTRYEGFPSLP